MQYQVLVENHTGDLYLTSIIGVPDCVAEGQTRDEAIEKARVALVARLSTGEVITIEVETPQIATNPWIENNGRFKQDPTFEDFLKEIEANRKDSDSEEASG